MSLSDHILSWPDRHQRFFETSSLSAIRSTIIFITLFIIFFTTLALPEMLSDQNRNYEFYVDKLTSYDQDMTDPEKWFSPRMWDYRGLIYTVHIQKKFINKEGQNKELAVWQSEKLSSPVSKFWAHYIYNPGFYWDIGLLMPLSLSFLCMAFYVLLSKLQSFAKYKQGQAPNIPTKVPKLLFGYLLDYHTILLCLAAGIILTAGNHSTGWLDNSSEQQYTLLKQLLRFNNLGAIPFILACLLGAKKLYRLTQEEDSNSISLENTNILSYAPRWVSVLFWLIITSSVISLVIVLSSKQGWYEPLTGVELSIFKPVQRVVRVFFMAFGILAVFWVNIIIISRSKVSSAVEKMLENTHEKMKDRIATFNNLAENELHILEYFGIFATLTMLGYFQSAVFLWDNADIQTNLGLTLLTGLILISLVMLIIPIIYIWYVIMDSKRFDRWASGVIDNESPMDSDLKLILDSQAGRIKQVLKMIISRTRFIVPLASLFFSLLYTSSLTGWLAKLLFFY